MEKQSDTRATVLAVLSDSADQAGLSRILAGPEWDLQFADSLQGARTVLCKAPPWIAISECCLPGGHSWKELLGEMGTRFQRPPLIVASRLADTRLWAEVLNLGGYDLLVLPFERTEVLHALRSAWLSWNR